ncbi:MAG: hypothetical protein IKZ87_07910 [Actinomycetaceae bacterium]|nr:hypothetical protein [Actinomycetaceae bacterium]
MSDAYFLLVGKCYKELLTGIYKPIHKDATIPNYFREVMHLTDVKQCHFLVHNEFGKNNESAVWCLFVDWCREQGVGEKISNYDMEHYDPSQQEYESAFNGSNPIVMEMMEKFTDYALQAADASLPKERDKLKDALLEGLSSLSCCCIERYKNGKSIHCERFVCFNRSRNFPLVPSSDLFNASFLNAQAVARVRELEQEAT